MNKSNEKEKMPNLPTVDYSMIPKEIEEVVAKKPFIVEKKMKLTWDKRQFLIRIPSEIAKEMNITAKNQILFRLTKPFPGTDEKLKLDIELI